MAGIRREVGMKIIAQENSTEIWARDVGQGTGMASTDYVKSGKQTEIIAALECALEQARFEALCRDDANAVSLAPTTW